MHRERWCCWRRTGALVALSDGWLLVGATDRRIRYSGRTLATRAEDDVVRFDWAATRVIFVTTANRVIFRMDGGRSHFNVVVDGQQVAVLQTSRGLQDYELDLRSNRGLLSQAQVPQPSRVVELQKRTEPRIASFLQAAIGRTTYAVALHGILLEAGAELEGPPQLPERRLEFVGDSETSGFGILGPSEPGNPTLRSACGMSPAEQDVMQTWPALVARVLGAEFHVIAWSGIGVLWNSPMGGCSTSSTMLQAYSCILGSEVDTVRAPASVSAHAWVPHVVAIYIGGNDWYSLKEETHDKLSSACAKLLRQIRALRPESLILVLLASKESFCSCISTLEEQAKWAEDMQQCWRRAVLEVCDEGVRLETVHPSPIIDVREAADWGQMGHWSPQGHAKWASAVAPLIARQAGWASSDSGASPSGAHTVAAGP